MSKRVQLLVSLVVLVPGAAAAQEGQQKAVQPRFVATGTRHGPNDPSAKAFTSIGSDVGHLLVFEPNGRASMPTSIELRVLSGKVKRGHRRTMELELGLLRAGLEISVTGGQESSALKIMEELIDLLKKERDELNKSHGQQATQLALLEKTKEELAQAHIEFGLLSQLLQARNALARLESTGVARAEELGAARLRVQECEKRLRDARGK